MTNDPAYRSVSYALKRAVHDYTAGMRNLNTPLRPDQIALLDAERTLSQTRQTYVDALAAYHDAQARLDRLTTPAPVIPGDNR